MPKPRYAQVSLDATPYYHCISRCVRRAFLCGRDFYSGQSYEHRRDWIEAKMLSLTRVFALDICAYAIMRNHYHVILHVDRVKAQTWSQEMIVKRWHQLFSGTNLSLRFLNGEPLNSDEKLELEDLIQKWKARLMDISWFMRVLNESIARRANLEDDCSGRFWEGRFKSQALLDEKALIACMAYVDLNPIRAKQAQSLQTSRYTSVNYRLKSQKASSLRHNNQPGELVSLGSNKHNHSIPIRLDEYIALLEWTKGALQQSQKNHTLQQMPASVLQRLNISNTHWLFLATQFESRFKGLVGGIEKLREICQQLNYQRIPGRKNCALLFG